MIKIICVGKVKEKYLKDAIEEYKKRLTKYTDIEIIELNDLPYQDINKVIKEEGKDIINHLDPKSYIVTLEINGKTLSSEELATKLDNINITNSNITFIIGGSYGLSEEVRNMSNFKLSFSKLTFPHQLFRVMLLEQIYRTYKIRNNESYHK